MPDRFACPHQDTCAAVPAHARFDAVASSSGLAVLRVLSLNRDNVGLAGLATMSIQDAAARALREELASYGIAAILVVTCNRTELYWRSRVPGDDERAARAFAEATGVSEAELALLAMRVSGEAAAAHLFRVTCGLESLVLGEAEILGQIRAALEASPGAGPFLDGVFRGALRTGRAARAETGIGEGAVSVASTAVHTLADLVHLAASRVLIVGAGDTAHKVGRLLRAVGVRELVIANRTRARGEALAAALHAVARGLDDVREELRTADAVVCAAGAPSRLVTASDLRAAMSARVGRSLAVVDLAMPGVVEPTPVDGVTLVDLAGLERVAAQHRERRRREVPRAEAVIARELGWLRAWARHHAVHPLVSGLRQKVEEIRRAELARVKQELHVDNDFDDAALERLSRRLLDQVLAIPLAALHDEAVPIGPSQTDYLKRLFSLDTVTPCAR